ncbi:hypothetical protein DFJ73DRAFT_844009, partial [Zopfochytrium polystomum]
MRIRGLRARKFYDRARSGKLVRGGRELVQEEQGRKDLFAHKFFAALLSNDVDPKLGDRIFGRRGIFVSEGRVECRRRLLLLLLFPGAAVAAAAAGSSGGGCGSGDPSIGGARTGTCRPGTVGAKLAATAKTEKSRSQQFRFRRPRFRGTVRAVRSFEGLFEASRELVV